MKNGERKSSLLLSVKKEDSSFLKKRSKRLLRLEGISPSVLLVAAILLMSVLVQLHGLGWMFDFDSYDEGVYWQTLRAVSEHETLCAQVFCSQPPMFIWLIWPFFKLFGSGILAARLGVLILSTIGDAAGAWLGYQMAGRAGCLATLLLLISSPLHAFASRTLVAEEPSLAWVLLAVASAYSWARPGAQSASNWKLGLSAAALALGILCKLSAIAALIPIAMVILWQCALRMRADWVSWKRCLLALLVFALTFVAVFCISLLPLAAALSTVADEIVGFHLAARLAFAENTTNLALLEDFASRNAVLIAAAVLGLTHGIWRHDIRVVCTGVWLVADVAFLVMLHPLYPRHLVLIIPPLACLAASGVSVYRSKHTGSDQIFLVGQAGLITAAILLGLHTVAQDRSRLTEAVVNQAVRTQEEMADKLRLATLPADWIITDAPFATAMAGRSTPPTLVDTSVTRIASHYLTDAQLVSDLFNPRVKAVLIATGRLSRPEFPGFHAAMAKNFTLRTRFSTGAELWTR